MRICILLILATLLWTHTSTVHAQHYTAIEQRLTPEQMKATGLVGLSAEQLALLNTLLKAENETVGRVSGAGSNTRSRDRGVFGSADRKPIVSKLKGDFRGWSTGTTFDLENGQRWSVIEGNYHSGRAIPNLGVVVALGKVSGWYMQVEGQNPRAKVRLVE